MVAAVIHYRGVLRTVINPADVPENKKYLIVGPHGRIGLQNMVAQEWDLGPLQDLDLSPV